MHGLGGAARPSIVSNSAAPVRKLFDSIDPRMNFCASGNDRPSEVVLYAVTATSDNGQTAVANIFVVFGPENACQAPNRLNSLFNNNIRVAY